MKSPPSAIVVTREISRCSDVFQATTADFGAFSLGYRRVVASPVIRRNPAFTVPIAWCGLKMRAVAARASYFGGAGASSSGVNCLSQRSSRPRSCCSIDTIPTPMPSPGLTMRTTARTRTSPCGVLKTSWSVVPILAGVFVRINNPPRARFSTGDTVFWLPFFHATSADFGTFARGYFRLFCVSVSGMERPVP